MNAPDQGDEYISNGGDGPMLARVVSVNGKHVGMERWEPGKGKWPKPFSLSLKYLQSKQCGWVRHAH